MKYVLFSTFLLFAVAFVALPDIAGAQGFVQCGLTQSSSGNTYTVNRECNFCELVSMFNTIIQWLVTMFFLLFAILLVIAGFNLMTSGGNESAKRDAKEKLTNAIIGIVIVLGAFLIVDTLMRYLVGPTGGANGNVNGFGPWSTINCFGSNPVSTVSPPSGGSTPPPSTQLGGNFVISGIDPNQTGDYSGALTNFQACVAAKVPAGTYFITSISDDAIAKAGATETFASCAAGSINCAHRANSCHYGGTQCLGKSYALDVLPQNRANDTALMNAARSCTGINGGAGYALYEGNHIHISIGQASNCACN